jgi:hypothetical protein
MLTQRLRATREDLLDQSQPNGAAMHSVIVEPFGSQSVHTSFAHRITVQGDDKWGQFVWSSPLFSDQANSDFTTQRLATIIRENLECEVVTAPVVQDVEFLFPDVGWRRLHVFLGQPVVIGNSPDGLPWDFMANAEIAPWLKYEQDSAQPNGKLIARTVAAAMDLDPALVSARASFTLWQGAWRPGYVVDLPPKSTSDSHWPPEASLVESAKAMLGAVLGRSMLEVLPAGSDARTGVDRRASVSFE